jgi:hypothetical protein
MVKIARQPIFLPDGAWITRPLTVPARVAEDKNGLTVSGG